MSEAVHSQERTAGADAIASLSQPSRDITTISKIKWTWQLPASIKYALSESKYKEWFTEKMMVCESPGKTFYRFVPDNGNLLDGDHRDVFFQKSKIDISDNGVVIND